MSTWVQVVFCQQYASRGTHGHVHQANAMGFSTLVLPVALDDAFRHAYF